MHRDFELLRHNNILCTPQYIFDWNIKHYHTKICNYTTDNSQPKNLDINENNVILIVTTNLCISMHFYSLTTNKNFILVEREWT